MFVSVEGVVGLWGYGRAYHPIPPPATLISISFLLFFFFKVILLFSSLPFYSS